MQSHGNDLYNFLEGVWDYEIFSSIVFHSGHMAAIFHASSIRRRVGVTAMMGVEGH